MLFAIVFVFEIVEDCSFFRLAIDSIDTDFLTDLLGDELGNTVNNSFHQHENVDTTLGIVIRICSTKRHITFVQIYENPPCTIDPAGSRSMTIMIQ